MRVTDDAFLRALADLTERRGYPPTTREMQEPLGYASNNTVEVRRDKLTRLGLMKFSRGVARSMVLTDAGRARADVARETSA